MPSGPAYQSRWSSATLSTAADSARIDEVQCSWKLESSTARTSYGSGSITASTIGSPTLPQATVRSPPARSIASSICTVVVLPLVPVTASQGAGLSGSRSRQASSTSPQIGTPRSAACASSGAAGRPSRAR